MEQLRTLTALMDYARKIGTEMGPRKVAIALAEDVGVLESIEAARKAFDEGPWPRMSA